MIVNRIAKIVFTLTLFFVGASMDARANRNADFDWNPLMDAITMVESEGDAKAVNGVCCGAMQIAPILVRDCNNILQQRGQKKRYTLQDRFNVKKSREMFVLIMSHYNPDNNLERAIRLWNGGVHYKQKSTQKYYNKVMAKLKK